MNPRRAPVSVFLVVSACMLGWPSLNFAQNENETVGFRPNHAFEGGNFGENIDILNGGLNLTTPIGPQFQVNSRLGYGVTLSYNSKVWDTTYYGTDWITSETDRVVSINQGPFGIGFSGHFGRIIKDKQFLDSCDGTTSCPGYTTTYTWVASDGSQHIIYYDPGLTDPTPPSEPGPPWTRRPTNDLSYTLITGPYTTGCPNGKPDGCFKVETPDGLTYTLEKQVDCITPPDGRAYPAQYVQNRAFNTNFCGWYTTLIEDLSTTQPNNVRIAYDTRDKFEHAIASVTDSVGRVTKFYNCEWREDDSTCVSGSEPTNTNYSASDRSRVATYRIDVPTFSKDAPGLDSLKVAQYGFLYELTTVRRAHPNLGTVYTTDPVLKLMRIDYPDYLPRNATLPDQYSLYFGYDNSLPACLPGGIDTDGAPCEVGGFDGNGDYAELTCRTLPLLRTKAGSAQIPGSACDSGTSNWANYKYTYGYYFYVSAYDVGGIPRQACAHGKECGAGSPNGQTLIGVTRHLINKQIEMPQGTVLGGRRWRYYRPAASTTNPGKVIVKDPFLNDTVYFYHSSASSNDPETTGSNPEDGYAPEWNDGTNHRIDYYEGSEATGKLVRSVLQDQDADAYQVGSSKHAKDNVRVKLETTIHQDDGGRESRVTRNRWDGQGHWLTEIEVGSDVPSLRVTTRQYQVGAGLRCTLSGKSCATSGDCAAGESCGIFTGVYLTGNLLFEEVSDGSRVLSHVDNVYDSAGKGRLVQSLSRANPGAPASPYTMFPVQKKGDSKTTYTYSDASGSVMQKDLSTDPALVATYSIKYAYAPAVVGGCSAVDECGGYLARKAFLDSGSVRFYSIKRDRDVNTGLIKRSYDTADVYTDYNYDPLSRLTDVTPQGEDPSKVDYPSLTETTLTQGDPAGSDYVFTRYRYDGLGRQVAVDKRPADPARGYPCQTTKYDVMGRVVFRSEWVYVQQGYCSPGFQGEVGTTYSFQETNTAPTDPFGRVRREIPADANPTTLDKVIQTKYFGTSSQVRVNGAMGPNQKPFPEITTFYRDAFERLVSLEAPAGSRCGVSGKACATDANCPSGETCMAIDGGANAFYTYDALDNLIKVDLTEGIKTQTRRFAYDGLKRLKQAENPENGVTVYSDYDPLGNILSTQDASGNVQRFDYDFAGRARHLYLRTPGGTEKTVYEKKYDESLRGSSFGKLTTVLNNDEDGLLWLTENLTYNGLGGRLSDLTHLFKEYSPPSTSDFTETTSYLYDTRGQLISLTYPIETSGTRTKLTVTYAYQNGAVISATEVPPPTCTPSPCGGTVFGQLTYSAAGAVEQVNTPGGGRTWITYDQRNRPWSVTGGLFGTTYWTRKDYESGTIGYDGAGNIYGMGSTHSYGYDAANRLIYANNWEGTNQYVENFSYDSFGNMTRHWLATNTAFTENDDFSLEIPAMPKTNRVVNRTTSTDSGMGMTPSDSVPFTYDANGNVIEGGRRWIPYGQTTPTEDILRYGYNPLNQLRRAYRVTSVANTVNPKTLSEVDRQFYDSGGNRIAKTDLTSGVKTYYVRDLSGQVLSEFERPLGEPSDPEWQKDYLLLAGRMLGLKENLRPQPARNLRVTQKTNPVTIAWDPSPTTAVTTYNIYRKRDPQDTAFTLQASTSGTTYSDPTSYSNLQIVNYRITAKVGSTSNIESPPSTIKVAVGDTTVPPAPVLSAVPGDGRVTLSWTASTDSSGIAGYEIDRRTSTSQPITPLTSKLITSTAYVDLGLTNGTKYYYLVKAVDTAGNSGTASTSCNKVRAKDPCDLAVAPQDQTPPAPPRGLKVGDECEAASATKDAIKISWDPNPVTDSVASFEIYRSADLGTLESSAPIVTGLPSTTTTYTDQVTTPTPPSTWYYAMKAVDATGNKSSLSEIRAILPRDRTRTPQIRLSAKAADSLVTVSWVGEGSYLVYRRPNASRNCGDYVFVGLAGSGSPIRFTDAGMRNNIAYDYAVTDKVGDSESTFSTPALAVPLNKPSSLKQCRRYRRSGNPAQGYFVTDLQWDPSTARPYQPILASTTDGTLGYLKGYHLYHHQLCNRRADPDPNDQIPEYLLQDNNLIREVVARPGDKNDPYLLATDQVDGEPRWEWEDPRFYAPDWAPNATRLTFSPAFTEDIFTNSNDLACNLAGNTQCWSCMMPKAVYKVYAEGTWLTAESDWPDYFDPLQENVFDRCATRLVPPFGLTENPQGPGCAAPPECKTAALKPPRNVSAVATGPGTVTVSWEPVTPDDGSEIAGYYVYGREDQSLTHVNPSTEASLPVLMQPLPFIKVGPGQRSVTISGLSGFNGLKSRVYRFNVASFDDQDRVSLAYNGTCTQTGETCTDDTQCNYGDACEQGSGARVTAGAIAVESVKPIIWTLNDYAGYPVTRKGIKVAWAGAGRCRQSASIPCTLNSHCPTGDTCEDAPNVNGYRVYRSIKPEAPQADWCLILKQGPGNPQGVKICPDSNAYSQQYSTGMDLVGGAPSPYYWDLNVTPNVTYYYRVTSVSTSGIESDFTSADVVSALQLDYDGQVPPPPSGFKAWAPSGGTDMLGVYLSWCKNPAPDPKASETALPASSYVVYRSTTSGGPYTHKVNIPTACFAEDANGNRTNRCEITGTPTDLGGIFVYPSPAVQVGCDGKPCAIVDRTFTAFPQKSGSVAQQDLYTYYYVVTAVGPNGKESQPAFENAGYLNYCGTGSDCVRRDADGNGDYLVCGERASLDDIGSTPGATHARIRNVGEEAGDGDLASYRIIGQDASSDPAPDLLLAPPGPSNPYTPPARFVFYVLDHLGSVRAVLDKSAILISTHTYLPFGEERPTLPEYSLNNRFFTGHERDKEDGLDYMVARYYSSSLGRFMETDPIGGQLAKPQSWNGYSYVRNNPLRFTDPRGLIPGSMTGAEVAGLGSFGGSSARNRGMGFSEIIGDNPNDIPPDLPIPKGSYVERVTVTAKRPTLIENWMDWLSVIGLGIWNHRINNRPPPQRQIRVTPPPPEPPSGGPVPPGGYGKEGEPLPGQGPEQRELEHGAHDALEGPPGAPGFGITDEAGNPVYPPTFYAPAPFGISGVFAPAPQPIFLMRPVVVW